MTSIKIIRKYPSISKLVSTMKQNTSDLHTASTTMPNSFQDQPLLLLKTKKPTSTKNTHFIWSTPARNEPGAISKNILDHIYSKLKINQWKNTNEVLKWFSYIKLNTLCPAWYQWILFFNYKGNFERFHQLCKMSCFHNR